MYMVESSTDLIAHLLGASKNQQYLPEELLHSITDTEGGISAGELAEDFGMSRASVHRKLDPLVNHFLLYSQSGEFSKTGLTDIILREIDRAVGEPNTTRSDLRFLFGSPTRISLLRSFKAAPASKAELSHGEEAPSRATVYRNFNEFDDRGWVTSDEDGRYCLTDLGANLLAATDSLLERTDAAMSRAEVLYGCGDLEDIPLLALSDGEMFVDTPDSPHESLGAVRQLAQSNVDKLCVIQSFVSYEYADAWDSVIRGDAQIDMIVTEPVLYNLPTEGPYKEHVRRGLEARNFTLLVEPDRDRFPYALGIIDDEILIFGPPHVEAAKNFDRTGTLITQNEELVSWGQQKFQEYRQQARQPGNHVITRIIEKIQDSVSSALPRQKQDR
jgi:predicted transcriptional regulator